MKCGQRLLCFLVALLLQFQEIYAADGNLLQNAECEEGNEQPDGWQTFSHSADVTFIWDDSFANSGRRSLSIKSSKTGSGMWQQRLIVVPGQIYVLTGHVAFSGIDLGLCALQLVFRDATDDVVQTVDFPGHRGTRDFALDFPAKLKVRAPEEASFVEVNCLLDGTGQAWFDDLFFGPAPLGRIEGIVTSSGVPLPRARVFVWGNPWGQAAEALSDEYGRYAIESLPVAFPRYVLLAEAKGHRTQILGKINVVENETVVANFELPVGNDPKDDLRVKFGTIGYLKKDPIPSMISNAVIPKNASGYPDSVVPYLASDEFIYSDHPDVQHQARRILRSLAPSLRRNARSVAWAIYDWVAKNIEHDGVFLNPSKGVMNQPFKDVTSGIWQTISDEGWCVGKNIYDWSYRPHELLQTKSGICLERAWLVAALLRALNVPSRASFGALEFWAQDASMNGAWIGLNPTGGRASFRESGKSEEGFMTPVPIMFSVQNRPILQADWDAQTEGLWRESHPWTEEYEGSAFGYAKAIADLAEFADSGQAPEHECQKLGSVPPDSEYKTYYSDVSINLYSMIDQKTLDVRFPLVTDTDKHVSMGDHAYWTNHPECVTSTWIEEIANPPVEEKERWFHVMFDLSSLFEADGGHDESSASSKGSSTFPSSTDKISLPKADQADGFETELFHLEAFHPSE